jgi:hypothetical protein
MSTETPRIPPQKMLKRDLVTEVERLTAGSEFLRESYEAAAAAILALQIRG